MTKTNAFDEVNELFKTIDELGINTIDELNVNVQLYERTFFVLQNFISICCLNSKVHRNKKGELISGNREKTKMIVENSSMSRDDIVMDALVKVMNKFNLVLASQYHTYYVQSVINSYVNDILRTLDLGLIYLDTPVNEHEDACTIGALIPDYKWNPEESLIEKESIEKLEVILAKKEEDELQQKKDDLIRATKTLDNPAEYFAYISLFSDEFAKNRELKKIILNDPSKACKTVLKTVSKKYSLKLTYHYKDANLDKLFKIDKGEKAVGAEISRLRNRASNKLK